MHKTILCIVAGSQAIFISQACAQSPQAQRDYRQLPSVREASSLPPVSSSKGTVTTAVANVASAVPKLDVIRLVQGESSSIESVPQVVTPELGLEANPPNPETPTQPSVPAIGSSVLPQKSASDNKGASSTSEVSKLWDVATMTGPMADISMTLGRVNLKEDWRHYVQVVPNGVRTTTDYVQWNPSAYTWTSPVFAHRPLYFEQPNLERYGNGARRITQPALSSAHFFVSVPLLPVKMLHNAPWADIYTLGEGRPGNNVPMQSYVDSLIEE